MFFLKQLKNYWSEWFPERRIFSLGALLGWVVRDSVFLVVLVLVVLVLVVVGPGGRPAATHRV